MFNPQQFPKRIPSAYGEMFLVDHYDPERPPKTWVIALNSGLQARTGPRRLYLHLARELSNHGFGVSRVDLPGIGDSDGPPPPTHFDMHDPANVPAVIDYVISNYKPEHIILTGLCAGARVSVKAGHQDDRVDGVIAYSMPTFTASPGSTRSPEEPEHRISKTVGRENVRRLKGLISNGKLWELEFWKTYLNPKRAVSEIAYVGRSVWHLAFPKKDQSMLGKYLTTLIDLVRSGKPVYFIFGERDKIICDEFEELGLDIKAEDAVIVPDGTHVFSTYESHQAAIAEALKWLQARFPAST